MSLNRNIIRKPGVSGAARLAGVMGWPVRHSRSPRLHGYWLDALQIDGAYVPLAVPPEGLEQALRALPVLGFRGVNLTVPHKERGLGIVDEADDLARRIGAVNTVTVAPDGRLLGTNTDAFGFIENLRDRAPDWRPGDGSALVLGAGGASRAVVVALQDAGVSRIIIANRTPGRAETLVNDLAGSGELVALPWTARADALAGASLVVNTTTLGMDGDGGLDLDLAPASPGTVVADIVYTPLQTPLLRAASARGLSVVDGLGMLIHQARPGFRTWFGADPEPDQGLRAMLVEDLAVGRGNGAR